MTCTSIFLASLILTVSFGSVASAQFSRLRNPKVEVTINHPPELNLKVRAVLFTRAAGECLEKIAWGLESRFVEQGLEVVQQEQLGAMLTENNLSMSRLFTPDTAVKLGKIAGPSAPVALREGHVGPSAPPEPRLHSLLWT